MAFGANELPLESPQIADYTNAMSKSSQFSVHNSKPGAGFFVGRQREMSALKMALVDAQSGQPGLVMLVGEAGIDKTSTAKAFTEYSLAQGVVYRDAG